MTPLPDERYGDCLRLSSLFRGESVRADAKRNYDRIVEAARELFREQGYDASLDEVAKRAGVGPGTLYRHFPKRENLIDAILQSWMDKVTDAADKALAFEGDDRALLLNWFEEYVRLISQHKGGPAKITRAMGDPESPIMTKCQVLAGANARVIDRLREDGALRDDVETLQVCRLVGGIATVADQSDLDPTAVRPMLEVVVDGLLT
nr:TetR/AcrR family transcriptional regulator [Nocardioides sp. MAH-18]